LTLSKFTLDFEEMKLDDKSLNILAEQICLMKASLKELSLRFKNCQEITSQGLKFLSKNCLQYLGDLESLSLNFNDSQGITNQGLCVLSAIGLQNLKGLKELNLCFENDNEIGDESIWTLGASISENLTQLGKFRLRCDQSQPNISQECLMNCFHMLIENLSNLKEIRLKRSFRKEIGPGVADVIENFKTSADLRRR